MRVIPVHPRLVRVDDKIGERYAVPTAAGRYVWDHTGRAVCPVVQAAIAAALSPTRLEA